jgi:hypothetical protein
MNPEQSRLFLRNLSWTAMLWLLLGMAFTFSDPVALSAFFQVYFFTALDLVLLILLFWKLFFVPKGQRGRSIQLLIIFTFKLVCLGLLAITLKRLRNTPAHALALGVLFIWVGPMLAGLASQIHKGNDERATRF